MCCSTVSPFCTYKQHVCCTELHVSSIFLKVSLSCLPLILYFHMTCCHSIVYLVLSEYDTWPGGPNQEGNMNMANLQPSYLHANKTFKWVIPFLIIATFCHYLNAFISISITCILLNSNCLQMYGWPTYWPTLVFISFSYFFYIFLLGAFPFLGKYFKDQVVIDDDFSSIYLKASWYEL